MFYFIPDAPHTTKWLTRRQAVVVVARKRNEGAGIDKKEFQRSQVWDTLKDPKTYLYFFLGFSVSWEAWLNTRGSPDPVNSI
jgi:hypothetical protein